MTENEMEKELIMPVSPERPEEEPKMMDSPEMIVRDLLKTEKDIALETLRLMRSRYERERFNWEKLLGAKERDIAELKSKLDGSEERLVTISGRLDEERQNLVEHIKQKAAEFETRRLDDRKKWEHIGDEIKSFREEAQAARSKLSAEQEYIATLKRESAKRERALQERLNAKDEELAGLKEQILAKEEISLKYKSEKDEEIRLLQDSIAALKSQYDSDKQEKGRVIEKKDIDMDSLKKALGDMIIQLNIERKKKDDALEESRKLTERMTGLEIELKASSQKYESDRIEYDASYKAELAQWEKYKKEFVLREETLRRETEEQVKRIIRSVEIIEQQLAEEQQLRKSAEDKLKLKDEEIRKLLEQKDEIAIDWRKMLTAEQELRLKRQSEILAEFDKIKAAREEDLRALRAEIGNLQAGLAEENKLYTLQREQNKQLLQKTAYLEENRLNLITELESKEKTWKESVALEREMFKRQIEELSNSSEAQLRSRDAEITRLDEDLNMLNGRMLELRQKLSLEKNENNNRLERISEFEAQIKSLTSKYNEERAQWDQKFQFIQQQWEEQRRSLMDYQKNLESQYSKDIQAYEERLRQTGKKEQ